jgi:hypothetical protein
MAAAASGPRLEIVDDPFGFAAVGGDRVDVEMLMMTRRTRTQSQRNTTRPFGSIYSTLCCEPIFTPQRACKDAACCYRYDRRCACVCRRLSSIAAVSQNKMVITRTCQAVHGVFTLATSMPGRLISLSTGWSSIRHQVDRFEGALPHWSIDRRFEGQEDDQARAAGDRSTIESTMRTTASASRTISARSL